MMGWLASLIATGAATLTLLFFWAAAAWTFSCCWWLVTEGRSRHALRIMRYSVMTSIVCGSGSVVWGGAAWLGDVLVRATGSGVLR